jgi:hypothetical protein
MTKLEVTKKELENKLVFFYYKGRELRGLISNSIPAKEKEIDSNWFYIPTSARKEWAAANTNEQKKNVSGIEIIDIEKIMWCVAIQ